MWTGEEGGVDRVVEEGVGGGDEDRMGGEGRRPEVQEYGVGRGGPLDRSADFTVPADGSNLSGGFRLPMGKTEPLNQPSGNIIGSAAGKFLPELLRPRAFANHLTCYYHRLQS